MSSATVLSSSSRSIGLIAAEGGCADAALGWACACDFRFATRRARELLFSDKIDADAALACGLVTRLLSADSWEEEAMAAARALITMHEGAMRMMKANLISAEQLGLGDYIELETSRHLDGIGRGGFERLAARFVRSAGAIAG